ncbi:MAG: hypothetical protein NZ480_03075 [Bdellovibrionaceae bacterium]|nr:hypothetical protein [Pseudobdellovibrionaceae bacterium]MDW8190860.1 hypothetical protein [Pseudobdellovibrionaceae bacterium]
MNVIVTNLMIMKIVLFISVVFGSLVSTHATWHEAQLPSDPQLQQGLFRAAVVLTQKSFQTGGIQVNQAEEIVSQSLKGLMDDDGFQIVGDSCPINQNTGGPNFCLMQQFKWARLGNCVGQDRYFGLWGVSRFQCVFDPDLRAEVEVRHGVANLEMGFGFGITYKVGAAFLACNDTQNCLLLDRQNQFSQKGAGFAGSRCGGGFFSFFVNRLSALFLFGSQFGLSGQVGTQTLHWRWLR